MYDISSCFDSNKFENWQHINSWNPRNPMIKSFIFEKIPSLLTIYITNTVSKNNLESVFTIEKGIFVSIIWEHSLFFLKLCLAINFDNVYFFNPWKK